jgi:hypothetical protein
MLTASLTDEELWLWCLALAGNDELIQFGKLLRIVAEGGGPPRYISTAGIFTEYELMQEDYYV